jgi:hypothetical protein
MRTTIEVKVAQISNLNQETVIKYGREILKLDLSQKPENTQALAGSALPAK